MIFLFLQYTLNNCIWSVFKDGAEEAAQDGGEQSSSPLAEKAKTEQSAGYEEKVVIICFGCFITAFPSVGEKPKPSRHKPFLMFLH